MNCNSLFTKTETILSFFRSTVHRGAFCQFSFRRIYYYGSNKSTGKEIGKTHLCVVGRCPNLTFKVNFLSKIIFIVSLTESFQCYTGNLPSAVHRGAFFQFLFWWIHYCHSSKSTGKETGKTHLCFMKKSSPQNFLE